MKLDYRALKDQVRLIQLLDRIGWKSTEGRGDQLRGPCPLPACHSQSNSGERGARRVFSVHQAKDLYRCFRCGSSGNVLDFWSAYRGLPLFRAGLELHQQLSARPAPFASCCGPAINDPVGKKSIDRGSVD